MSAETLQWLNRNVLVGFTEKRGTAWHYRASDQEGFEPNHYPQAIPVDDVQRRLFDFTVEPTPIYVAGSPDITLDGVTPTFIEVPDKVAWRASDNGDVLGIFSSGYRGHQYREWLLESVANLLDDDLSIGSAGLLRNRGQAWVSVEVPDTITTPEGVQFRPNLLAASSFDGSLSTTYKRVITNTVCDNTLGAALSEAGQTVKVRHSKYSHLKLGSARDALAIVHTLAEDFTREIARLCEWDVTERQWKQHLDVLVPVPAEEGRGLTIATNKRAQLQNLWDHDQRVAPWKGTAWGVLQAHNTWRHHFATVRGGNRAASNQANALAGLTEKEDRKVLAELALVTAS